MYPQHTGRAFWFASDRRGSGFANEVSAAVDVMKDGAGDVVHKPLKSREVSPRRCGGRLNGSGRSTHDCCKPIPPDSATDPAADVLLAIPGDQIRRRTRVIVGQKDLELTTGSLKILHLLVAHREARASTRSTLVQVRIRGCKGISSAS